MELTLDQALQKGVEAHKAGRVQEADRYYTAILNANPKHPDANHNMGVLAVGVGKVEEALPFFRTALEVNSNIAQFWLTYIDALIKLDRMADAKAVFEQAKSKGAKGDGFDQFEKRLGLYNTKNSIDQELPQEQLQDLINLHTKGHYQEAVTQASQLLEKFTTSIHLYNILGASNESLGNLEEAIEAYTKAIFIKPDYAEAYYNMGNALKDQGKLDEALEAYTDALSIKPDFAQAQYNRANILKDQDKLEEAVEAYKKVLSIKPDDAETHNNMANALKDQGKLDEAIEAFTKAISIRPDYAEAYSNIGNALEDQGKLDEAIEAYTKALSINPYDAGAHNNMGNALKAQGKLEQAIQSYKKMLSIKSDYAEAHFNIGIALREQGKLEEAIEAYNKALSIKPDYGSAKHMLSALTGNTTKAPPREYVENLFDLYSQRFESSLVSELGYKIPKLIKDILVEPDRNVSLGSVLDLGCGTGLLGAEIRKYSSKLEGIDVSNNMLEIATKKNVYDKLSHLDITEYLYSEPLDFDYYIALDVFIYVGDLTEIFRLIKSRNKQSGHLVFSTEHTELDGYHILKSGRYSHSKSYIESLCVEFEYNISYFSTVNLRKEKGRFLIGGIYMLDFTKKI